MKQRKLTYLKSVAFVFFCASTGFMCTGSNYNTLMVKAEKKLYREKDPLGASKVLIPKVNQRNQDQLLFMMEAGAMLQMAGDYKTSDKILLSADRKADAMYKSISKEVAAFITNERGKDYMGEDYERILLNMTLGINYLMQNDFQNAQVEFKKVNNKLEFIRAKSGKKYKENLMALYLSAVAHAATGEYEYAYVDLKKVHEMHPGLAFVGLKLMLISRALGYNDDFAMWQRAYPNVRIPQHLQPQKNAAELVIIYESGQAPRKASRGRLLADREVYSLLNTAIIAAIVASPNAPSSVSNALVLSTMDSAEHPIPKYVRQKYKIVTARLDIMQNNRLYKSLYASELNNVEKTILKNFESHYMEIRQKMISRLAVKAVAAIVAKTIAQESVKRSQRNSSALGFLVGTLTGVAVGAALFSSEKPDLRCWHTIPASYHANSILLPQGVYQGKISYFDRSGRLVKTEDIKKIEIKPDKPVILLLRTFE